MTLDEVYGLWRPWKETYVKRSTMLGYCLHYAKHLRPALGGREVAAIDRHAARDLSARLLAGLSVKTVRDIMGVLRLMLDFAREELDMAVPDTHWRLRWPTAHKGARTGERQRFTRAELRRIIDYCVANAGRKEAGILIGATSGLRIGEICALRWTDVDFRRREYVVTRTYGRVYDVEGGRSMAIMGAPKTLNAVRRVPMADMAARVMRKLRGREPGGSYVLTGTGVPLSPRVFREYYSRVLEKKVRGCRRLRFHALRHTFASYMIDSGTDPKTLAAMIGHSNVTTTLNLYVHPSEETKKNALKNAMKKLNF